MTIRKGEAWGHPGALPEDGVVVSSDHEAADVIGRARREGRPYPALGLVGGDLCRPHPGGDGRSRQERDLKRRRAHYQIAADDQLAAHDRPVGATDGPALAQDPQKQRTTDDLRRHVGNG